MNKFLNVQEKIGHFLPVNTKEVSRKNYKHKNVTLDKQAKH